MPPTESSHLSILTLRGVVRTAPHSIGKRKGALTLTQDVCRPSHTAISSSTACEWLPAALLTPLPAFGSGAKVYSASDPHPNPSTGLTLPCPPQSSPLPSSWSPCPCSPRWAGPPCPHAPSVLQLDVTPHPSSTVWHQDRVHTHLATWGLH